MDNKLVNYCLSERQHLILIENDVIGISERIKDLDENIFIVYNLKESCYEIHSIESFYLNDELHNKWSTYQTDITFEYLDERVLEYLYNNDIQKHGEEIFIRLEDESNLMDKHRKELADMRMKKAEQNFREVLTGRNTVY
jgi:hypothetical protein